MGKIGRNKGFSVHYPHLGTGRHGLVGGKAVTPLPLNPPSAPEKERGRGALLHGAAEPLRFIPLNSMGRDKKQTLVFDGIFVGKKEFITNCSGRWLLPWLQTPHPIATKTFKQ